MRSIILVQVASTLLIGAARASPVNDHANGALELNSQVHPEICEHNDYHLQKRCIKNNCPPNHSYYAGKCHQDKHYFKQTIESKYHKDTSHKKEHSDKYHSDDSDDSDDDDDDESEKEKKSKHLAKDHGEFRGYRCGSQLYIKPTIERAAKKGCELKKNKQKKAGYPETYLPSSRDEAKKLEDFNPTKKQFVYPIHQEPVYKFSHQSSDFALFDEDCEVNGVVFKKKTNPCPADKWCLAQIFQKSEFYYVPCDQDYRQSN